MVVGRVTRTLLLLALSAIGFAFNEDEKWSKSESSSEFSPSQSVLEQWTTLTDRSDKVMKLSPNMQDSGDRYIINRPIKNTPSTDSKEVTETDLFLLGAIEKLAYRLDFMEKRLRRTEDMIYQVIAGTGFDDKQEPCNNQFERIGGVCYHVSQKQMNWKSASAMCRSLKSHLVEFDTQDQKNVLEAAVLAEKAFKGKDYWTGGLNPGLLWIWGSSAKPVVSLNTTGDIQGTGRCLLLGYLPPTRKYRYKGADCAGLNNYICRSDDNAIGRRLERLERRLLLGNVTNQQTTFPAT